MPAIRIEWVPVPTFNLGLFGFDHLQLVYQADDTNPNSVQDDWFVLEGVRDVTPQGVFVGVQGENGTTTLALANVASGSALLDKIGTPESRGSRVLSFGGNEFNVWQGLAAQGADIEAQDYPYIAIGLPGSPLPTINSNSVVASLLYYAGVDIADVAPFGMRLTPGIATLLGSGAGDTLALTGSFDTIVTGGGDDTLSGSASGATDRLFGGAGDDTLSWSSGFNILHGGQPELDYASDGVDTVDYTGAGIVTLSANPHPVPHTTPDIIATHAGGTDHLFSIERIKWSSASDTINVNPGLEVIENGPVLDLGSEDSGQGDTVDFSSLTDGLAIRDAGDGMHLVQSAIDAGPDTGLWLSSAEWLVGSAGSDTIYLGAGIRGVEGGVGDDLIDARLDDAFGGGSPAGYDTDLIGGDGADTLVSGAGRSSLTGGAGSDRFILTELTDGAGTVEIVIEDADAEDRLFAGYNLFNNTGADFEGADLLPLLGAPGSYQNMVEDGWILNFDWRLESTLWAGTNLTQGVIFFVGNIAYEIDGTDLLIRLLRGVPETVTDGSHTYIENTLLPDTETLIRVRDYQQGDLGLVFHPLGEPEEVQLGGGLVGTHYPGYDQAVHAITNNGVLTPALPPRPEAPVYEAPESEPAPVLTSGTSGDDVIALSAPRSRVEAGAGDDTVSTGSGNDILDGGAGADALSGGTGDDRYLVDNAGDVVIEAAAAGSDTVVAATDWTLSSNVEHLTLTGSAALGTGNSASNRIVGNAGNNTLDGLAGTDTLSGGLGDDTLVGGTGSDGYAYAAGDGDDVIVDTGPAADEDVLLFASGIAAADLRFYRLTSLPSDLVIAIADGGRIVVSDFFASSSTGIDGIRFGDGTSLSRAEITALGNAEAPFANEPPQAVADTSLAVAEGGGIISAAALLENDRDLSGDTLTVTAVGTPTAGSVALQANGDVLFTAPSGFAGEAHFTYTISDGNGGTAIAMATVTVLAPNTPLPPFGGLFTGTSGSDTLQGTAGHDTIDGRGGDDIMSGLAGNDHFLIAGGNEGFDRFDGGAGTDRISGSAGDDVIGIANVAGNLAGIEIIDGGGGADTILLTAGNDTLDLSGITLASIELISGGDGNDAIVGSSGADAIDGGAGNDTLSGGAGDDTYTFGTGDTITEQAAQGTDTVLSSVAYTLAANLENLTLLGSANVAATGNSDPNLIVGNSGNNTISAGAGNDIIDGGAGTDAMSGGAGDDVYDVNATGDTATESASSGIDEVRSSVNFTLGTNVENLTLIGSANVSGTGNSAANIIVGNSGNNTISAGAGNDEIDGGGGSDSMSGGAGDDIYFVDAAGDVTTESSNSGADEVRSTVGITLATNIETLTLLGSAAIGGTGNSAANTLNGNGGANVLNGGSGNDTIAGGAGNDTIVGGAGKDVLSGGGGADNFDFNASSESSVGTNRDIVSDFIRSEGDVVDLATIDAKTTVGGDQAFSFIGSAAFSNVAGQLRFANGVLSGDTNGNGTADFEIQITGLSSMQASDFVL